MTLNVRMTRSSRLPRSVRSRMTSIAAVIAMAAAGAVLTAPAAAAGGLPPAVTTFVQNGITYTLGVPGVAGAQATDYNSGGNSSHPSLTIPDSAVDGSETYPVVAIGQNAFKEKGLTEVSIGNSVTTIGNHAFAGDDLKSVTIGNSVTTIDNYAFADNDLKSVTIGEKVTTIGNFSFYNSHSLKSVTIPGSVTIIGWGAFSSDGLTSVTIGNSVTTIGKAAFFYNPSLTSVVFTGEAPTVTVASDAYGQSFDTASGSLVLEYPWRYDVSQVSGGYTSPKWKGYDTQAVATVAFKANGHGTAPADKEVVPGNQVSQPLVQPPSGYTFTGWYTDAGLANKFSFNTVINTDLTLYAGWEAVTCHPFPDVNASNVHCRNIEWLAGQGITKPADGNYHPASNVTRGSMAAFLFRLTHPGQSSPKCSNSAFPDVDSSNIFCGYITWAANNDVAKGYPSDGTFRSDNGVTRGAMAAFLKRIATNAPTPTCHSKPFADVTTTETFCGVITWMKDEKLTFGVGDGSNYGTTQIVNRQSMASFLHRIYNYMH